MSSCTAPQCSCTTCSKADERTPRPIDNRPGQSTIAYRSGTYGTFRATMLAALSDRQGQRLRGLTTRAADDPAIALVDAWAVALDGITFYQERFANEHYLRTAVERRSVVELAALVGYRPSPGVAASTLLACTIDGRSTNVDPVVIPARTAVQSVPGPNERPQTFETSSALTASARWNAVPLVRRLPFVPTRAMERCWISGTTSDVRAGDGLLLRTSTGTVLRTVRRVDVDATVGETCLHLSPAILSVDIPEGVADGTFTVGAMLHVRAAVAGFGHQAPKSSPEPGTQQRLEWPLREQANVLSFDGVHDDVVTGRRVVAIDTVVPWMVPAFVADDFVPTIVSPLMRTEERIMDSARSVSFEAGSAARTIGGGRDAVTTDAGWAAVAQPAWAVAELLDLLVWWIRPYRRARMFRVDDVETQSRADYGIAGRSTMATLDRDIYDASSVTLAAVRTMALHVVVGPLTPGSSPLAPDTEPNMLLVDGDLRGMEHGRTLVITGQDAVTDEVAADTIVTDTIVYDGRWTTLRLVGDIPRRYRRSTVVVHGNVVAATHGQTVHEELGSGDARASWQSFGLRQGPLTYVSAATPSGIASTLELRVNDTLWHETDRIDDAPASARTFITRRSDAEVTTIHFGDGRHGSRLPTGRNNVTATYRRGLGRDGNVRAGQLTLLQQRPYGLQAVTNPVPAAGGDDPENLDHARVAAPSTVRTLDRIVSLRDYQDVAGSFAGIGAAMASWAWMGERRAVVVTVSGAAGTTLPADAAVLANLYRTMRTYGDPWVPVVLVPHRPVAFSLHGTVTVHPDADPSVVRKVLQDRLSSRYGADRDAFGEALAVSDILAVLHAEPEVLGVDLDVVRRHDGVGPTGSVAVLPAAMPTTGSSGLVGAELLVVDIDASNLAIQPGARS